MISILFVDDEPSLLDVGKIFLEENAGYSVQCALSGKEAIDLMGAAKYDAIVADYQMPGMDGITLLKKVRETNKTLPYILFTGRGREEVAIEAINEGADFYLQKGGSAKVQYAELAHKIRIAVERRAAEAAFKESVELNRRLVENLPDYVVVYGPDGKILYANPASAEALGYSAEELIGKNVLSYVTEDYRGTATARLASRRTGKDTSLYEIEIIGKEGLRRLVMVKGSPIQYGSIPATLLVLIDITDRSRAEVALQESERRLRSLIASINDLVFVLDKEFVFREFYQHGTEVLFMRPELFIGKHLDEIGFPEPAYGIIQDTLMQTMQTGNLANAEYYLDVQKGRLWFDLHVTSFQGSDGTRTGLTCVVRDITDRKRAEESLQQVIKKLTLLSGITRHEINNQIIALDGYLSILEKKLRDPTLNEYFQKTTLAVQRISAMIQFTKEYEKIGIKAPVWQDCRTLVGIAGTQAPLGQIQLKNDLPAGSEIFADPLISLVIYNLMDNAVRYGGNITTIRVASEVQDGDWIISFDDDGVGVPVEEKEKIFDYGFGKNTGMGLFLAREILSITGMTIWETGEQGKGARFEVMVPEGMWREGEAKTGGS